MSKSPTVTELLKDIENLKQQRKKIIELLKDVYSQNPEYTYHNHCADAVLFCESSINDKLEIIVGDRK